MECAFKGADSTKLTVTRNGSELNISKGDVRQVIRHIPPPRPSQMTTKSEWIWAGVGFGIAAGAAAIILCTKNCDFDAGHGAAIFVAGIIGAFYGVYSYQPSGHDEVLYQAP